MMAPHKRIRKMQQKKRKEDRKTSDVDWAGLPDGPLGTISKGLSMLDYISFGYVCKSWHNFFAEEPHSHTRGLPWLISSQNDSVMKSCFSMVENKVWEIELPEAFGTFCCGTFRDWLVMEKPTNLDKVSFLDRSTMVEKKICFLNPFSRTKIDLPKTSYSYTKTVLSASPTEANCVSLLLSSDRTKFIYLIPGSQTWQHHILHVQFEDAVCCNCHFYFVTPHCNILDIDTTSIASSLDGSKNNHHFYQVEMPKRPDWRYVLRYLVDYTGELLLVCQVFDVVVHLQTCLFEVFKLDFKQMAWKKLEDLGDDVLLVGNYGSETISYQEVGAGKANCIYFTNDRYKPEGQVWWDPDRFRVASVDEDWAVFSLDDKTFNGNSYYCGNPRHWAPVWVKAPIWWYQKKIRH